MGLIAMAGVVLTGCTNGSNSTLPLGPTPSISSSSPSQGAASSASADASLGSVVYRDAGFRDDEDYLQFMLPSGNIGCAISQSYVTCEINNATWKGQEVRPADCDGDWDPYGISLNSGRVFLGGCASDTVMGGETLAYGQGVQSRDVRCASARSGLRCELRATGRGFNVNRTSFRQF